MFQMTEKEKELLEALVKTKTLTEACRILGIHKSTGSQRLKYLRLKRQAARDFIDQYDVYRGRLPSRYL